MKQIPILLLLGTAAFQSCEDQPRPNILFAISDDQSYSHTSFAGCTFINTPAFDRIAREGIYFTNCYAGSPGCAPSRSTLVTGRYHWQNEQSGQHASSWLKKFVPFVDALQENGYYTGRTGKGVSPFQYARSESDSMLRKEDAAGISHSNIRYVEENDERYATGINNLNYFENFKYFMDGRAKGQAFFFWYGAAEPHRDFEKDSWIRNGKNLDDVVVPGYLPDNDIVRGDLLDYAVEIEWFDLHLERMLNYLEEIGELENTIVIVTSDNGMPFPRAKANCYDDGVRVPLALRYPKKFPGGRIVESLVSFLDFAPTILDLTDTPPTGMEAITGKSMRNLLESKKQGKNLKHREYVFMGRERHSSSRYMNWGYPQRAVRDEDYLFIWNIKPERWPAGAPQRINPENVNELLPMYGIDENGIHHSEWAFTDIDAAPSKSFIIENYKDENIKPFFEWAHAKRPEFELFNVKNDPYCLDNLAEKPDYQQVRNELMEVLLSELRNTNDPRVAGPDREIFDSYLRFSGLREFPKPE